MSEVVAPAMAPAAERVEAVRDLVVRSCVLLDEERFDDWLALFSEDFRYSIEAFSPDIGREMTWLEGGRKELADLVATLDSHQRDSGTLFRHPVVGAVDVAADGETASVTSSVLIVRTALDGVSNLFAAVRYRDRIAFAQGRPTVEERTVFTDTRVFPSDSGGSHVPL